MILLQLKTRISAYRREYSASVVLSWYILWLKALAGIAMLEKSQFRQLIATKFNWIRTLSQVATISG